MGRTEVLKKIQDHTTEIHEKFQVKSLSIFGSVARDEANKSSDVDVMVKFVCPATFDLYMDLKFFLEDLLGSGVDLVTDQAMRPQVRKAIEGELINVA